jgi:hypothetical protein
MKPDRWVFFVDADLLHDAALRVLGPFAVQGAMLTGLELQPAQGGLRLRIDVEGLNEAKASALSRRLTSLPCVRAVSLGWRSNGPPPELLEAAA